MQETSTQRKFKILKTPTSYKTKQEALDNTARIKHFFKTGTYKPVTLSMERIKQHLLNGKVINFGSVPHEERYLFAIDVDNDTDNKMSYQRCVELLKAIDIYPKLILETLSSKNQDKYRIIFSSNIPIIQDVDYYLILLGIIQYLNSYYPCSADNNCADINRVFYPHKNCLYEDLDIDSDMTLALKLGIVFESDYLFDLELNEYFGALLLSSQSITQNQYRALLDKKISFHVFRYQYQNEIFFKTFRTQDINNIYKYKSLTRIGNSKSIQPHIPSLIEMLKIPIQSTFPTSIWVKNFSVDYINSGIINNLVQQEQKSTQCVLSLSKNLIGEIGKHRKGYDVYKVFQKEESKISYQSSYSAFDLIRVCLGMENISDTLAFLQKLFNIRSESYIDKNVLSRNLAYYLKGLETLDKYPNLKKLLCSRDNNCTKNILKALIAISRKNVSKANIQHIIVPQLMANADKINEELKEIAPESIRSKSMIATKVRILSKLGLITKVPKDKINSYFKTKIQEYRSQGCYIKYDTIYTIPHYEARLLAQAEKIAKTMLRESISSTYKTLGIYNQETICKSKYYLDIVDYIQNKLNKEKYVAQSELKSFLSLKYPDAKKYYLNSVIQKYKGYFLKNLGLQEKTLNSHNTWIFGLTKEDVKTKGYKLNNSRFFYKTNKLKEIHAKINE